ncbi:MAG: hypothetical protein SGJ19_24180 [Planctomycetia bacterium]|nr:hypothetical protein [Planctomycetia bacterium]
MSPVPKHPPSAVCRSLYAFAFIASLALANACSSADPLPPPRKSVAEDEVVAAEVTANVVTTPVEEVKNTKVVAGVGRGLAAKETQGGAKPRTAEPRKTAPDDEEVAQRLRPEDGRLWTADDFREAKRMNDPRLVRTVNDWAALRVNDEAAGELIVELLEAPDKIAPADGASSHVEPSSQTSAAVDEDGFPLGGSTAQRRANPQLAEACVAALGANNSAAARKGLRRALLGTLATDLTDKRLVEATLKALATNRHPKHEDMLLTVLAKAEQVRPSLIGDLDANGLQEECLKQVKNQSSARFRRAVAVELVASGKTGPLRERLVSWLMTADFVNLPAQSVLYAGRNCDLETRRKLEKQFTPYGKDALLETLGRASRNDTSSDGQPITERTVQISTELWAPDFARVVAQRVREVDNLAAERELIALATALPLHDVRRETALLLKRRWSTGAKAWEKDHADVTKFLDPGLLLAVKSMPREDALVHRSSLGDKAEKPKLVESDNPEVQRFQSEKKAKEEWMVATESLVKAINERLRSASQGALSGATATPNFTSSDCGAQATTTDDSETATSRGGLPLRLPTAAQVISEYHLAWPRQWPAQLSSVAGPELVVHYVRMEQEERVASVQGFYRRQLKKSESRLIKQGNWLESVERLPDAGRLRSVDVMITRPTEAPPRDRSAKEPLVVDVLWIETPDFRQ